MVGLRLVVMVMVGLRGEIGVGFSSSCLTRARAPLSPPLHSSAPSMSICMHAYIHACMHMHTHALTWRLNADEAEERVGGVRRVQLAHVCQDGRVRAIQVLGAGHEAHDIRVHRLKVLCLEVVHAVAVGCEASGVAIGAEASRASESAESRPVRLGDPGPFGLTLCETAQAMNHIKRGGGCA